MKIGNYCIHCGKDFGEKIKEHILEKHYDYLVLQCSNDKKSLLRWVNDQK